MRHGRTNNNEKGIFNGRNDEDINETGIEQAISARAEFEKLDIDLIVCSTMLRARHTAEIVNTKNLPIIYDDRLVERDMGKLTGKHNSGDFTKVYWDYLYAEYDVEPVEKMFERVYSALDDIKEKHSDKNVLIVTHGGAARGIHAYFNGIPEDGNIHSCELMKNCQIVEYEYQKSC